MNGQQAGKFFVTGLPRSRTAWMSAFLSTGETLCYHEPSYQIAKIEELPRLYDSTFYRHIGVSESGLGFHIEWILENIKCRTLIIERDIGDVEESMREMGIPMDRFYYCDLLLQTLLDVKNHPLVKWVHFNSLVHKRVMQDIYWWLMPGMAFDEQRWEQFSEFKIEIADPRKMLAKAQKYGDNLSSLYGEVNARLREMASGQAA